MYLNAVLNQISMGLLLRAKLRSCGGLETPITSITFQGTNISDFPAFPRWDMYPFPGGKRENHRIPSPPLKPGSCCMCSSGCGDEGVFGRRWTCETPYFWLVNEVTTLHKDIPQFHWKHPSNSNPPTQKSSKNLWTIVLLRHAFMRVQICLPFLGTIIDWKMLQFQYSIWCAHVFFKLGGAACKPT